MEFDQRVRSYASDALGDCAPDRVAAVTRFETGERHAVYKVSYLDPAGRTHHVVVRVSLSNEAEERAQAEREAAVLRKVQGVAGPQLHDFRARSPWFDAPAMCMQFVPGEQRELSAVGTKDLEHLGSVVGSVHGLSTADLVTWLPNFETTEAYRDRRVRDMVGHMASVRDPLPASVQRRLQRALRLVNGRLERVRRTERIAIDDRLVLLHGDVAGGNVIWDPEPVLIDWEYARVGEPADEIAYLFSQNGLSAPQREAFWRGYRRTTDRQRLEHVMDGVRWWEPVTLFGSALWWVDRWARRADADAAGEADPAAPKAPPYYLEHATRRLDRFDQLFDG